MVRLALALLLSLLALAPVWAGRTADARVPVFQAPTAPQFTRVQEILAAAQASPTAVAILDRAASLRGLKPVDISFKNTGANLANFYYDRGAIDLSKRYAKGAAVNAVPTLVHEILHVAQHAAGTPAEALERELEAHALTLRVLDELGLKDDNSFSIQARARLKSSPSEYRDWMRLTHHLKYEYRPRTRVEIVDDAEFDLELAQERMDKLEAALNLTPSSRELRRRYDAAEARAQSIYDDIGRLSENGWRRYKRFAAKVWKVLEAEHARLNGR